MSSFGKGITLAVLETVGECPIIKMEVMKGWRSCEMVWSIVEGLGSHIFTIMVAMTIVLQ